MDFSKHAQQCRCQNGYDPSLPVASSVAVLLNGPYEVLTGMNLSHICSFFRTFVKGLEEEESETIG